MAKSKKEFGRIKLPKGTTANERAKANVQYPPSRRGPGPLVSLALKDYCEMCGASRRHPASLPLEAAFDPSGQAKTLCRDCRMGSAELLHERSKGEPLDSSDVATILAALRLFQKEYEDFDSVSIADAWPMHFNVQGDGDDITVEPEPLGSIRIDDLCERINCAKVLTID
jgi:hypothetical protein